jgi:hypothetical protein
MDINSFLRILFYVVLTAYFPVRKYEPTLAFSCDLTHTISLLLFYYLLVNIIYFNL